MGVPATRPVIEMTIPSALDSTISPRGEHRWGDRRLGEETLGWWWGGGGRLVDEREPSNTGRVSPAVYADATVYERDVKESTPGQSVLPSALL